MATGDPGGRDDVGSPRSASRQPYQHDDRHDHQHDHEGDDDVTHTRSRGVPAPSGRTGRSAPPQTRGTPAGGTSRPAPGHGAPPWRRAAGLLRVPVLCLALGASAGALAVTVLDNGDGNPAREQAGQIAGADLARDVDRVRDLTDLVRRTQADLGPVVTDMTGALPSGPVTAERARGWQAAADAAATGFADPPSAGTAVNVARGSLAAAVDQLAVAADTAVLAAAADGGPREALLDLAARQRDSAVVTWSVGATQLDVVSIEAGFGHTHLFLATADGALSADPAPEGSDARDVAE